MMDQGNLHGSSNISNEYDNDVDESKFLVACTGEEELNAAAVAQQPKKSSAAIITATATGTSRRNNPHQHWSPTLRRMSLLNTLLFLGLALSQAKLQALASAAALGVNNNNDNNDNNSQQTNTQTAATKKPFPSSSLTNIISDDGGDNLEMNTDLEGISEETWKTESTKATLDDHEQEEETDHCEEEPPQRPGKDVYIVATVDGTLAAIDSMSGKVLWKQPGKGSMAYYSENPSNADNHHDGLKLPRDNDNNNNGGQNLGEGRLFQPLIATTTTAASARNSGTSDLTAAIPSIDGSVFLTTLDSRSDTRTKPTGTSDTSLKKTDIASLQDLVTKAPFVDSNGFFYLGSRHTTVAAIDSDTGEVLYVASADDADANRKSSINKPDPEWKGRNVVWIGRVDLSVSIFNAKSSTREVQFSAAEIISVNDMVTGNENSERRTEARQDPLGLSRTSERAPNVWLNSHGDQQFANNDDFAGTPEPLQPFSELVATPSGNLAYRNPDTGHVDWVADEAFETPIAYAIHSSSGQSLAVDIIPDVTMPSQSSEYLTKEIERQIALTLGEGNERDSEARSSISRHPPVVGTLQNGQLFAMLLGRRRASVSSPFATFSYSLSQTEGLALDAAAVNHHHTAASSSSVAFLSDKHALRKQIPRSIGLLPQHRPENRPLGAFDTTCGPSSPVFPSCLFKGVPQGASDPLRSKGRDDDSMQELQKWDAAAIEAFGYHEQDGFMHHEWDQQQNSQFSQQRPRNYRKILRILGSWLPPTIALIFVVSFELGRRKRQKHTIDQLGKSVHFNGMLKAADHNGDPPSDSQVGQVIQITDQVLGYGGHGTVVYRGTLEGRSVAVKRMLKTYLASADREISLLIESDGHPNVVRYFLKEVRGDFVYLALELCDLSLHDLIGTLGSILRDAGSGTSDQTSPRCISKSTKRLLLQIATGVKHLHSLRIVHNDLKPANILLALAKEVKTPEEGTPNEVIFANFQSALYCAKISDMGLGKMLAGQSSFGASAFADGSMRGQSSNGNVGMGPGTVGWMAPEQMKRKISATVTEASHSGDASSLDKSSFRASRSVDIFSLGCIFYSTLVPGLHPFGEWYEREANIMHNRPSIEALQYLSIEAYELVSAMIQYNPRNRPNAKQICEHPFFWTLHQKIAFICDLSDRLETDSGQSENGKASAFSSHSLAIERNAIQVVGLAWDKLLYKGLTEQKYRTYDPSSVRDLLRLMRNKKNHFQDLDASVRQMIGSDTDGLMQYFESCFPKLLMHCYQVCCDILPRSDPLVEKYSLHNFSKDSFPAGVVAPKPAIIDKPKALLLPVEIEEFQAMASQSTSHTQIMGTSVEDQVDVAPESGPLLEESRSKASTVIADPEDGQPVDGATVPAMHAVQEEDGPGSGINLEAAPVEATTKETESSPTALDEHDSRLNTRKDEAEQPVSNSALDGAPLTVREETSPATKAFGPSEMILWEGSTASKTLNCRGWTRSDAEWVDRSSSCNRKQAAILTKCAEDPKFRTRLCNHWDTSLGSFCPMRRKNKCVFAHGPIELRVKEGKRQRWGKLVDKHGNNSNRKSSGGEDTYGAARSIETVRKGEGKWNSQNNKQQNGVKKQSSGNKKKPKPAGKSS